MDYELLKQNIMLIQRTLNSLQDDEVLLEIKRRLNIVKEWLIANYNNIHPSDQLLIQFVEKLNEYLNTWDLEVSVYFELSLTKCKIPNYIVSAADINYNNNTIQLQLDYDCINALFKQKHDSDRYIRKIMLDIIQVIVHQYAHYIDFRHIKKLPYQKRVYIANNMRKRQQHYKENHDTYKSQQLAYATQIIHRLSEQGYTNSEIVNMIKSGQILKKSILLKFIKKYSKNVNGPKIIKSILIYIYQMLNNKYDAK